MESAIACQIAPGEGDDVYVNATPLRRPLWGRGAFGGALVAQALVAGQKTVPPGFSVHSMHCHFLQAADNKRDVYYHVSRVRDGASLATRTVEARQASQCVFSAVLSFARLPRKTTHGLTHQVAPPPALEPPSAPREAVTRSSLSTSSAVDKSSPFECVRVPLGKAPARPELQRIRQWMRARWRLDGSVTHAHRDAHLAALAYMSDNYFIGTVARAHRADRFNNRRVVERIVGSVRQDDAAAAEGVAAGFRQLAWEEARENEDGDGARRPKTKPQVAMMVSLDHAIYFHNQDAVDADDWMLAEMETPWADDERALVVQRVWTRHGLLVATCVQEGLVRVSPEERQTPKSRM